MEVKTMKAKLTFFVAAVLSLLVFCPAAIADWTEPAPVTELNTGYHDKSPFLSFDGLTLYFCRQDGPWGWTTRIYKATRQQPSGPFTSVEEISALNISNAHVSDPWVSPDNLRMYYYRTGGGRARLMLTERASTNDPWLPGVEIVELSALGDVYNPDLTADERIIVFSGDLPGGQGGFDVWIATRADTNSPFANVTNLAEINSSASDAHPYISPDGLILYFASDRNGAYQLFRATRQSLDAPFVNLEHLSFFDSPDSSAQYPFLSSDGSVFYFGRWKSGEFMDIYVSYLYTPQWSKPVPLTEVNTNYADRTPFLSYDGLTLYFSRRQTPQFNYDRIYQATRESLSGPFTQISEISTLNSSHGDVARPWVSPDNLRMYYWGPNGILEISKRTSTNDPWPPGTKISELNALGALYNPALTPDELTIVFMGYKLLGGKGNHDIWMATRPDKNSPFVNVRNLEELNTPANDADPFLLPDGMTLYFTSDVNGDCQIYRATRESLDAPFGNIEHLSFFDVPGMDSRFPVLSSDGTAFYFCIESRASTATSDIYVSYLSQIPPVPEPNIYYVDGVNGNDNNNGLTLQAAFVTIQKGLNTAGNRDTVLVYPALYREGVDFLGKAVTVQGVATSAGVAVIENPGDFAVSFYNGEEPNSILKNFVVQNSFIALFIAGSSPTISNLTIIGNNYGVKCYAGSDPAISNCIFWNNTEADLIGCQAQYSWVQDEIEVVLPDGLVSHWKLDEGSGTIANDSVGSNHGTIHGAQWSAGQVNSALSLDGSNDYVNVPDNPALNITTDLTISAWVNFARGGNFQNGSEQAIVSKAVGSGTRNNPYDFRTDNSPEPRLVLVRADAAGHEAVGSGAKHISLREWHHVIVTVKNNSVDFYIDGIITGTNGTLIKYATGNTRPLCVGKRDDGLYFNGLIDEVLIFNRAMSAEEVQLLYQAGLNGSGSAMDPLFADAAAGDYHLRSRRGRYWPQHDVWVLDKVTSPCVDGGDPAVDPVGEPMPNGGRIDIGAYGGTPYASMSDWPIAGDVNRDGVVDLADLAIFCNEWLLALPWAE
jgi:Tol biopolymer transport system component